MPNKEQKKFKEVIKKRRKRVVRLARSKKPKIIYKYVELPKALQTKLPWYQILWNKIASLWRKEK